MEDMIPHVSLLNVFVCNAIALQIKLALAFSWKNVSRNIISCEHDDAQLIWEYDLKPGEYVKAKTWFTGENKTAKRIAYWKDTDGLKIEPAYTDRVRVAGKGNDSLILRRVTTSDEGIYTLLPNFPLSSEPDPRLALNLNIYVPPLKEKGCCKPDINATRDELHAFVYSELGCGKPSPTMNWNISRNKKVRNVTLILGENDRGGMYKVCLIGPAVATCFKGDKEILCTPYTVPTEQPHRTVEVKAPLPVGVWIGISLAILFTVAAVFTAIWFGVPFQKNRRAAKAFRRLGENPQERLTLLETARAAKSLTKELVHIYKEQTQFQKADSQINLQTEIYDGASLRESDMDINIYRNVFQRNEHPLERILIQGEVGCGKTTWCNTLTQEWRKAHDPNNLESNDNITFLKEYELLFNISLGKVQKFANINELISYLHISMFDQLNIDVYDYIKDHNTIIIIQGLDEYTKDVKNILSDKGLKHATVFITSTPSIWGRYYQGTLVDRAIHVKGLKKDEMIKRAQKILKDDRFPQAVIDAFFRSIESNELDEFTTEPIFFPFLVEAWKMNCILPSKRAEFLLDVLEKQIKGKVISLVSSVDDYRFGFENSIVLKDKQFIIHCGKIVKFLGEIALKIFIDSKDGIMLSKRDFDDIFKKQNLTAENSSQFIIDFCVSISLVSIESDEERDIHTISFRHKVMLMFLAAIYLSTLKVEEIQPYVTVVQSSNDLAQFLRFLSNQSKD